MGFLPKKTPPVARRRVQATEQGGARRPTPADLGARYAFRRNRTLTGSLSSNVSSVNEQGAELKSARVHVHHLRRHRRHATMALFVVMAIAAGTAFLIYQSIIYISITASAPGRFDGSMYAQAIQGYVLKHPFERFRFSLNTNNLVAYLQSHGYPEVDAIDNMVAYDGISKASLHVTFREPVVAWRTVGSVVYVDTKGNTFNRSYYQEPAVQVVDQTGIPAQGGQVLASDKFLGFIGKITGRMKENGFVVTQVILPANTTRQVQVLVSGIAYPIKFSIDRPVGEQAEDAARAVRYLMSKGIAAKYIDVRVSGKAFYQ